MNAGDEVLTGEKLVERYSLGWEIELTVKELKWYDELDRIIPCEGKGGGVRAVGAVADTLRETAGRQLGAELGVGGTAGTIPTAADGDDFPKRGATDPDDDADAPQRQDREPGGWAGSESRPYTRASRSPRQSLTDAYDASLARAPTGAASFGRRPTSRGCGSVPARRIRTSGCCRDAPPCDCSRCSRRACRRTRSSLPGDCWSHHLRGGRFVACSLLQSTGRL